MSNTPNLDTKKDLFGVKPEAAPANDLLSDADFPKIEGERSYDATREYNARTKRFLESQGQNVDKLAHDAADALDGPEGKELEAAEEEGRSGAIVILAPHQRRPILLRQKLPGAVEHQKTRIAADRRIM